MISITKGTCTELHIDHDTVNELKINNEPNKELADEDEILNVTNAERREYINRQEDEYWCARISSCCEYYCEWTEWCFNNDISCYRQYRCHCEDIPISRESFMILKNKTKCCALVTVRKYGQINITAFPGYYNDILNFMDVINRNRISICVDDVAIYRFVANALKCRDRRIFKYHSVDGDIQFDYLQIINDRVIVNDIKYQRIDAFTDCSIIIC